MARQISIVFRGQPMDVQIDHDGGYEPDTGAHEIDWHFSGLSHEQHLLLRITPSEEEAIVLELSQLSDDGYDEPF